MTTLENESITLVKLAEALLKEPKANLKDLAESIGVSRTTLYRFCSTREELIQRLLKYGIKVIESTIADADLNGPAPEAALRRLLDLHLQHKEITAFLLYFWRPHEVESNFDEIWNSALDGFFLKWQKAGFFKIDIPAATLTEAWSSLMTGMIDSENRGRVPRRGMVDLTIQIFMNGVSEK